MLANGTWTVSTTQASAQSLQSGCIVLGASCVCAIEQDLGLSPHFQSSLHTWGVLLLLAVRSFRCAVVNVAGGVTTLSKAFTLTVALSTRLYAKPGSIERGGPAVHGLSALCWLHVHAIDNIDMYNEHIRA
jgi:hypothetical protein